MDIGRIPPTSPQTPIGSAEENILELTKEMITQIEKLKDALAKEKGHPNLVNNPDHIGEFANSVIALDKVTTKTQQLP